MDINLLKNCENFVRDTFSNTEKRLCYHNIGHIEEVVDHAMEICSFLKLDDNDTEIVLIAAWFHDIYYVVSQKNHEYESSLIAENFLLSQNYPKEKIEKVKNCIKATKIPQSPKNLLEEIICDADLFHVGTDNFFDRNEKYKNEITKQFNIDINNKTFIKNTIDFFSTHSFYTSFSKTFLQKTKEKNILSLKNQLDKLK